MTLTIICLLVKRCQNLIRPTPIPRYLSKKTKSANINFSVSMIHLNSTRGEIILGKGVLIWFLGKVIKNYAT